MPTGVFSTLKQRTRIFFAFLFHCALCFRTLVVGVTTFTPLSSIIRRLRREAYCVHPSFSPQDPFIFMVLKASFYYFFSVYFLCYFGQDGWKFYLFILTFPSVFALILRDSEGVFGFGFLSSWNILSLFPPFLMGGTITNIAFSFKVLLLTTSKKFWFSKLWLWSAWACISLGFLEAHPASLSFAKVRMCWPLCSLLSSCFFMSQVSSSVRNQPGSKISWLFGFASHLLYFFPTLAATIHLFLSFAHSLQFSISAMVSNTKITIPVFLSSVLQRLSVFPGF